jgi:hypothetical protein
MMNMYRIFKLTFAFSCLIVHAHAFVAPDEPIAGSNLMYVDSTNANVEWTVSSTILQRRSLRKRNIYNDQLKCTFQQNKDIEHNGSVLSTITAHNEEDCCRACVSTPICYAAVLYQGQCYLKGKSSMKQTPVVSKGRSLCIPVEKPVETFVSIPASVPGDLLSDLLASNLIEEPYYELNFKNSSLWNDNVWTYSTTFDSFLSLSHGTQNNSSSMSTSTSSSTAAGYILVFDGIKMGASVTLNGHHLGMAVDQFSRWEYDVTNILLPKGNKLTVAFDSTTPVDGRFMACTGGWDWAPYTNTKSSGTKANTFTKGIWKNVYLVEMKDQISISHVVRV